MCCSHSILLFAINIVEGLRIGVDEQMGLALE
jgi:hypothetical protein